MTSFRFSKFLWLILVLTLSVASRVEAADPAAGDTTADHVLGQVDFVQHTPNGIDGSSFSGPTNGPDDVVIDTQTTPHRLWLSDQSNNRVLGWENIDAVKNGAPADVVVGQPNMFSNSANAGGSPSASGLNGPHGLAVDAMHNLYVADTNNNRVLVFTDPFAIKAQSGQVGGFSAFKVFGQAGNFTSRFCNFSASSPNAGSLCSPVGVKLDQSDNLWVSDSGNNRVLAYFIPLLTDTVADMVIGQNGLGGGSCPSALGLSAYTLCKPGLLAFDAGGNLFVADTGDSRVLEYTFSPNTGLPAIPASRVFGQNGSFTTNSANSAKKGLNSPYGLTFDNAGNLFVADRSNSRVLEFTAPFDGSPAPTKVFGQDGSFTTNACNRNLTHPNNATERTLCAAAGVAFDPDDTNGNLWISDQNNSRLLRFTAPFLANPRANLVLGQANFSENQPNSVDSIHYNSRPVGIAIDRRTSPNRLYVADTQNNRVLGYSDAESFLDGARATVVIGQKDMTASSPNQGGSISAHGLNGPSAVAVGPDSSLYVADAANNRVLRFGKPFSQPANLPADTVFGQGGSFTTKSDAELSLPKGVAVDGSGNVYISDSSRHRVLEFNAGFGTVPRHNKEFGRRTPDPRCVAASAATLCFPAGLGLDNANHLFIADSGNDRVLEFDTPLGSNTQSANRVYGQASFTVGARGCVNGGDTDAKSLCAPLGVALDNTRMYVGDSGHNRILGFSQALKSTVAADTVFGQGNQFQTSLPNLGGDEPSAQTLSAPTAVATDFYGNLFTTDSDNNRVLEYLQPYAQPGQLAQSAGTMSFGTVPVGIKSSVINVTMTNKGVVPIFIYRITIGGAQAADFSQTNNCVGTLRAAASCTIAGAFKPSLKIAETATMTINDNADKAPQHIAMSGTGS